MSNRILDEYERFARIGVGEDSQSQTAKALAAIRSSLATVEARRKEDANNRQG